jgi:hypothetical protein
MAETATASRHGLPETAVVAIYLAAPVPAADAVSVAARQRDGGAYRAESLTVFIRRAHDNRPGPRYGLVWPIFTSPMLTRRARDVSFSFN